LLQLLEDFFRDDFPLNPTGGLTRPSGFSPFFEKLLDPPRESPVYVYAHTYIHTHTHTHTQHFRSVTEVSMRLLHVCGTVFPPRVTDACRKRTRPRR